MELLDKRLALTVTLPQPLIDIACIERFSGGLSLMAAQILSTIGVPLWQGDVIIGVLQVDNRASKGIFKEGDLDVLGLLAQSSSQAFARARLVGRLRVAEERQRNELSTAQNRMEDDLPPGDTKEKTPEIEA